MRIYSREEINTGHARPFGWIDCAQASGSQQIVGGVLVPLAANDMCTQELIVESRGHTKHPRNNGQLSHANASVD